MAMKCFNCSKGIQFGKQHKHHPGVAGGRWKKRAPKTPKLFKPNLHYARVPVGNNLKRVRLCTKCQRIYKDAMKPKPQIEEAPQVTAAA